MARRVVDYRVTGRHGSPSGRAALASLRPLLGRLVGRRADPLDGVRRLVDVWRGRLLRLADLGLPVLWANGGENLKFALNCPPAGVFATPRGFNSCRLPYCPWCWARERASDTHNRLRAALTDLPPPTPALVELRVDLALSGVWTADTVLEFVQRLRTRPFRTLRGLVGLATLVRVEPPPESGRDDEPPDWRVGWRALALRRLDDFRPVAPRLDWLEPEVGLRISTVTSPPRHVADRWSLVAPVGRFAAYPPGLVLGDARRLVDWLLVAVGPGGRALRTLERRGILRAAGGSSLSDDGDDGDGDSWDTTSM